MLKGKNESRLTLAYGVVADISNNAGSDDIAGITSSRGISERLTLFDDLGNLRKNDYIRVDFTIDDIYDAGLRSPIETTPP